MHCWLEGNEQHAFDLYFYMCEWDCYLTMEIMATRDRPSGITGS